MATNILQRRFTPENITELGEDEIFVFGSNLNGNHAGGAARLAVEKFGAIEGQAEGLQGKSYAIPTLSKDMQKLPLDSIKESVSRLYEVANIYAELDFFVTKIGCGIAGFEEAEIAGIFKSFDFIPFNVILPMDFTRIKGVKGYGRDMVCGGDNYRKQYQENTSFSEEKANACSYGMHFVENPLEVFKYYKNKDGNVFTEVSGEDNISTHNDDTKIAVTKLNVGCRISFSELLELGLSFTLKKTEYIRERVWNKGKKIIEKTPDNYNTLAGRNDNTLAGQDYNIIACRNDNTLAGRNDNTLAGQDSNTLAGQDSNTLAGQDSNTLAGRNDNTLAGQDYNTLAGRNDNTLAGRNYNTLAGRNYNTLAGRNYNTLAGQDSNTLAGQDDNIIACRFNNTVEMRGTNNIAIGANGTKMKGKKGNVICLVEFNDNKTEIIDVKSAIIDGVKIKEDAFYVLEKGKFKEIKE